MGTFEVPIEIGNPSGRRWHGLQALVDSGSAYTWIPTDVLQALRVPATGRQRFEIAGGAIIERDVGETRIRLDGATRTRIVVFGDLGSRPLLGADTLEGFSLAVDPVNRRLIPVPALAMHVREPSSPAAAR